MYHRNVKFECIVTKLGVLDYEYICDRTAKIHKKILFITRVINVQILTTKYFSFQYSITYWLTCLQFNVSVLALNIVKIRCCLPELWQRI